MRSIYRISKINEGTIALSLLTMCRCCFFNITIVVLFSVSGCYTNIGVKETTELIVVSDDKTSTELRLESKPEKSKKQIVLENIYSDIENRDPQKAIDTYYDFISENPEENLAETLLAQLYLYAGNITKAKKVLLELLTNEEMLTDEHLIDAKLMLAQISGFEKDEQQQVSLLYEVLEKDPTNSYAAAFLGVVFANQGDIEKARKFFQDSLSSDSANIVSLLGSGQLLAQEEKFDEAMIFFDKAVEVDSEDSFSYAERAKIKISMGKHDKAIADLSVAIELLPNNYWYYIDRGRALIEKGDKESARNDFSQAISLNQDEFIAHFYQAKIDFETNQTSNALIHFERVNFLRSDYFQVFPYLGMLYFLDGSWIEAGKFFEKSHKQDPQEPAYLLLFALSKFFNKEKGEAINILSVLTQQVSQDSWSYDVARMLMEQGGSMNLIHKYRKEKNQTDRARISFYVGALELIFGNLDTARVLFEEATFITEAKFLERKLTELLIERLKDKEGAKALFLPINDNF